MQLGYFIQVDIIICSKKDPGQFANNLISILIVDH